MTAPGRPRTGRRGKPSRRTSIVTAHPRPIPYLTTSAQLAQTRERATTASSLRRPDRMACTSLHPAGLPHVTFPTSTQHVAVVQALLVAIRYEMIHDARIIPRRRRISRPHLHTSATLADVGSTAGRELHCPTT